MTELLDRRVLGAVRFFDTTTGLPVTEPMSVRAEGLRLVRGRRGDYVITEAAGLGDHTMAFHEPPLVPLVGSVRFRYTASDPAGHYLPRRGEIALPRDPDPAHADQAASLFQPHLVALFRAPAATTAPGWAIIRASVAGVTPGSVLASALIRVVRNSDGECIGGGMTDAQGEALVAVQGIPRTSFGEDDGPVLATEVAVRLEVIFDPKGGRMPDPDDLEARRATLLVRSADATLASGRVVPLSL